MSAPAIAASWENLRYLADQVPALFGPPREMARDGVRNRALTLRWLRLLEAWLRRLLLIAAAHLPAPTQQPPRKTPRQGERKARHCDFSAEDSAAWRCPAFDLRAAPRQPVARAGNTRAQAQRFGAGDLRLAVRFEALRRALADPDRHARRMARTLARDRTLPLRMLRQPPRRLGNLAATLAPTATLLQRAFSAPASDTS